MFETHFDGSTLIQNVILIILGPQEFRYPYNINELIHSSSRDGGTLQSKSSERCDSITLMFFFFF